MDESLFWRRPACRLSYKRPSIILYFIIPAFKMNPCSNCCSAHFAFHFLLHAASFCADLQKFLDMNNWMIIERTGWLISAALAQFIHWIDFVHYSSLILSSEFCEQTSGAVLMCVCVCCVWLESIPLLALACLWIHTPDPHMREKTQLRGSVA